MCLLESLFSGSCCLPADLLSATTLGHRGASAWPHKDRSRELSLGDKNDLPSDSSPQEVLCSVSAALLNLAELQWHRVAQTLGPPLPSGPRSVLAGSGRLHGAAVEMESRSSATALRQGTLVLQTQNQMRCFTCSMLNCKRAAGGNPAAAAPDPCVFAVRIQCTRNGRQTGNILTGLGSVATLPVTGGTVVTFVEMCT